jgi:alpha-glucosidase (family GH31 glycosyl hydrolase)
MIQTLLVVAAVLARASAQYEPIVPEASLAATPYHIWAHLHWAWLHANAVNQQSAIELVDDYASYGIPVGGTNIDSSWMTAYNTFMQDTEVFPDMPTFIEDMHARNIRVIFWATSMVNQEHPQYEMAVAKGFLVKNSKGFPRPVEWWHGYGGFLDYTNPEAVEWWHGQMDNILDMGADGFKCDGTDPYISEYIAAGGAYGYNGTEISYRDYADSYYGDFFAYTREKRGDAGLIMSRPVDCLVDPVSEICWGYSPQDVVLAGWMGDDDSTYDGFRNCVAKVIYSAWMNYPGFGCDIGGYRGNSNEGIPEKEVYLRWMQFGAFIPLMENGGNGEHRPWAVGGNPEDPDDVDMQIVAIYRKFVLQHHRLAPLLLTAGSDARENTRSLVVPLATKPDDSYDWSRDHKPFTRPDSYAYVLADALLVQPIVYGITPNEREDKDKFADRDDKGAAVVTVAFPEGETWLDWWAPSDASKMREGGSSMREVVPQSSLPVYVKRGALLPLAATPQDVPAFDASMPILFTWFAPVPGDSTHATMREPAVAGPGAACDASFTQDASISLSFSSHAGRGGFEVVGISEPISVQVLTSGGEDACESSYSVDTSTFKIVCSDMSGGARVTLVDVQPTL